MPEIHDPPIDESNHESVDYDDYAHAISAGPIPEEILATLPKRERDRERARANAELEEQAMGEASDKPSRKPGRRGGLLGRGTARNAANLAKKFGYLDEMNRVAAAGEAYATPRGPEEPPAVLTGVMPKRVADITSAMQMISFLVTSKRRPDRTYKFATVRDWRGLMAPMELAPLAAVPDRRWPRHAWLKGPDEIRGEGDVRRAARDLVQAYEDIHLGPLPQKPMGDKKPTAQMIAFNVESKAKTGKRYRFLSKNGYAGLWAETKSFNVDDKYKPDPDYPAFFRVEGDELKGRVAVIARARTLVEEHEGIRLVPTGVEGELGVKELRQGLTHTIYFRQSDLENLETVQKHLASIDTMLDSKAKAVQVALRELAKKIRRGGTIDGSDA